MLLSVFMRKVLLILAIILTISILILFSIIFPKINVFAGKSVGKAVSGSQDPGMIVSNENIERFLSSQEVIKELPKNSAITLRFYNFNSGEREWEESYLIKKGSVERITYNSNIEKDIEIIMHSRYISEMGKGLCPTIQKANKNGDLGYESYIGEAEFLIKYGSMLNYKDCFK